ncbi:MAG: hypothetical protein COB17_02255 [Sulfurimonas sp.]|nr:MAG: hypothetical protein COB17_02255 [Sulfurimonas sp.]
MKILYIVSLIFISLLFNACTTNNSTRTTSNSPVRVIELNGTVIDGLIKGASICLDINLNNICDSGEPKSTTSDSGSFTLDTQYGTNGEYKLLSSGGIDTATGQFFDASLEKVLNITVNVDTPSVIVSPLTTLTSKIYKEEKSKDSSFTIDNARDKLANILNLSKEQLVANPLSNINTFAKTQELIQATRILVIDIVNDKTNRSLNQSTFDEIFSQLALTINSEVNNTGFNVGKLVDDLQVFNPDISIDNDTKSFIQAYTDEIVSKVNELNSTAKLDLLQNSFESFLYKVDKVINDSANVTISLSDILTSLKDTASLDMLNNSASVVLINTTTSKPSLYLDINTDTATSNTDNITSDATPTLVGTAEGASFITILDESNNTISTTSTDSLGNYSLTLNSLVNGTYKFIALAKDEVGNTNVSDELSLIIDINSFILLDKDSDSGISDTDLITNITTPKILTDRKIRLNIKDNNGTIIQTKTTISNGNNFEIELSSLSDGAYLIENEISVSSGSTSSSASLNIVIDTSPPVFDLNISENNVTITENNLIINTIKATDLNSIKYSLSGDNSSDFSINSLTAEVKILKTPSINTVYTFNIDATDIAGNTSSLSTNIRSKLLSVISTDKFTPVNSLENEWFANSIAMFGDYIVVGASGDSNNSSIAGAVYLYKKSLDNRVKFISKISPDNSSIGDEFGYSVDIWENYVVIGAIKENSKGIEAGAVYLFKINNTDTVTQISKITASDTNAYDLFGSSVSINNNYIAIGSKYKEKDGINKVGAAYLFQIQENDTVVEVSKLQAKDIEINDYFGQSIDLSGDYIVVGANGEDEGANEAGAVYLFKKDSQNNIFELSKIIASDASQNNKFGQSLSIFEDTIIVGTNAGLAYVYTIDANDKVNELSKLSSNNIDDMFGYRVSVDKNFIAVGAYQDELGTGSVYLYNKKPDNTLSLISKLIAPDSRENEWFGCSVSINDSYVVVGTPKAGLKVGSAYLFDLYADKPYIPTLESSISLYESNILNQYKLYPSFSDLNLNFSISGADAKYFEIQNNILKANEFFDYESPIDADSNNVYSITIELKDSDNRSNSYNINISINDLEYLNKARLIASDAQALDIFGSSVSVDGNYILVGAKEADEFGDNAGAAYLYKKEVDGSVTELFKFISSNVQAGDNFGQAVSISGAYILIGTNSGDAYLFKREADNSVTELVTLSAIDSGNRFGYSLSMDGDYMLVGANDNNDLGAAYLFKRYSDSNVSQISKISIDSVVTEDKFADSVAIDKDYMLVGANGESSNSGAAYLYKRNSDSNISQIFKITSSDLELGDEFASSLEIDADIIVIGAKSESIDNKGAAYVFKIEADNQVTELSKLVASDLGANDMFGNSVSISGTNIVIGAMGKDTFGNEAGGAYLFSINGNKILEKSKLIGSDVSDYYFLGSSVAISGDNVLVGANQYEEGSDKSGLVYLFNPDNN